ncbi:hypothetical protein CHS0354_011446 [Potamilus streckersoni]|uniref:Uncharacterized protein n=1 Tax=Potamilus streckersoni TaxID=2493646 RepID=A0AAE0SLP3_9BIVA|nr:hypothetical protein CHS0354_011446 [Potamilus streckersoni]
MSMIENLRKRGKKKSKLEKILRQDHSDIHFENERLNEELSKKIDAIHKERHKHVMQRDADIKKLRREVEELEVMRVSSAKELQDIIKAFEINENLESKPTKTARKHSKQRRSEKNSKSGFYSDGYESTDAEDAEQEHVLRPKFRSHSQLDRVRSISGGKESDEDSPIKFEHYPEVKIDLAKIPIEWFTSVLPASDAVLQKLRRARLKSAPPTLRSRDKMSRSNNKLEEKSSLRREVTFAEGFSESDDEERRVQLVCSEPVKPVLVSLRRLRELTSADNMVERGPSRNTQRKESIKLMNQKRNERLDIRVKMFCKELEDLKERDIQEDKEKEEIWKATLIQEAYMRSLPPL